ncbi:MAG: hypothetical protein E7627_03865 [Ruminococcaceae bacterium]|nr:hypothetical protein [Oscillospiraceae bacterium]
MPVFAACGAGFLWGALVSRVGAGLLLGFCAGFGLLFPETAKDRVSSKAFPFLFCSVIITSLV